MLSNSQLLAYNQQGLIPGPGESEANFMRRAEYCQNIKEKLEQTKTFPFEYVAKNELQAVAGAKTSQLYDIRPTWIPIAISNYRLAPWHGGCAWIFQLDEKSPLSAFLQLRKGKGLFYEPSEIMAHEYAHIGRMQFEEPLFEEMFAYQSSPKAWRRYLGPLITSSRESLFFCMLMLAILALDVFLLASGDVEWLMPAMWLKSIPLLVAALAFIRLLNRHATFKSAGQNLRTLMHEESAARAILYRLKDSEIFLFAKLAPADILEYALAQKCLRWQLIKLAYMECP